MRQRLLLRASSPMSDHTTGATRQTDWSSRQRARQEPHPHTGNPAVSALKPSWLHNSKHPPLPHSGQRSQMSSPRRSGLLQASLSSPNSLWLSWVISHGTGRTPRTSREHRSPLDLPSGALSSNRPAGSPTHVPRSVLPPEQLPGLAPNPRLHSPTPATCLKARPLPFALPPPVAWNAQNLPRL